MWIRKTFMKNFLVSPYLPKEKFLTDCAAVKIFSNPDAREVLGETKHTPEDTGCKLVQV
jgi:hypothetical protein